jgi:predicted nucleotidyltransferase
MDIPDITKLTAIIFEWASRLPRISKVYLYGSYVKRNKPVINDIDIAIEIVSEPDDCALALWCSEGEKMSAELNRLVSYKVHLEWFDAQATPVVRKGIEDGHVVVYERVVNK